MTQPNLNQGDILIVDDTPQNLTILSHILQRKGYRVRPALTGALALRAVKKYPPELILLDVAMQDMDGYEVCEHLKADPNTRDIPVIFISALNSKQNKLEGFRVGGVDYITKPFEPDEVSARVKTHITLYQLRHQVQQLNNDLEQQVEHRTFELQATNTELKQEIAERKRIEVTNEALLNAIPDSMLRFTRDGHCLDVRAGKQTNAIANLVKQGDNLAQLLPPELAQQFLQHAEQALTHEDVPLFEYQFEQHGRMREYEARLVTSAENEVLALLRDVTSRKQAEQERLQLLSFQRDLSIAHEIQASLLPPAKPDWSELDIVCYSNPARKVGGDFYAYQALDGNLLVDGQPVAGGFAVALGDVSGKGMPAALLMAVSLASLQAIINQSIPPPHLMVHLDQTIKPYTRKSSQNCALCYIELIPAYSAWSGSRSLTMQLRAVNAGCIAPIIKRANGEVEWLDIGGMPLGVGLGAQAGYQELIISVCSGDMIILTSDGVVEANNPTNDIFGFERLEAAVKIGPQENAQAMLTHLQAQVTDFVDGTEFHDDLTMVIIKV